MKNYVGIKHLKAKKMSRGEYTQYKDLGITVNENSADDGYLVKYSDNYESWSPKDVFEKAYMEVSENNTITQKNVDEFIKNTEISTLSNKTTLVKITLVNGFEIIETSSCVDEKNYDEKIGSEICINRAKNKIWEYLGFVLQTGINGIK